MSPVKLGAPYAYSLAVLTERSSSVRFYLRRRGYSPLIILPEAWSTCIIWVYRETYLNGIMTK